MTDLSLFLIVGTGTWAVLVALFVIRRRRSPAPPPADWAERKRARFPIGAPDALASPGLAARPGVPMPLIYHG